MNGFIETFHIDWRLMIAQLFNFGIVFLAFYLLAAKPLRKLMKERGEEIETGLQNAKAGMEMIQKAKEEYEENTIKLRKQSIDTQKELKKELHDSLFYVFLFIFFYPFNIFISSFFQLFCKFLMSTD